MLYYPKRFYIGSGSEGGIIPPTPTTSEDPTTTVEALKILFFNLGGEYEDVENCVTNVEVLNAIAAKYGGDADASLNTDAVMNISSVADKIGGGGEVKLGKISVGHTSGTRLFVSSGIVVREGTSGEKIIRAESVTLENPEYTEINVPASGGYQVRFSVPSGVITNITGVDSDVLPAEDSSIKYTYVHDGQSIFVEISETIG